MFIKGKCAIYIDKNLKFYENSTGILVLCIRSSEPQALSISLSLTIKLSEILVLNAFSDPVICEVLVLNNSWYMNNKDRRDSIFNS